MPYNFVARSFTGPSGRNLIVTTIREKEDHMKPIIWTIVIAIIAFVIGLVAGEALGTGVGAGVGGAAGIVVGSQAGVCLALTTAEEQGWITANQAESFISKAVEKIQTIPEPGKLSQDVIWLKSKSDCDRILAEAKKG